MGFFWQQKEGKGVNLWTNNPTACLQCPGCIMYDYVPKRVTQWLVCHFCSSLMSVLEPLCYALTPLSQSASWNTNPSSQEEAADWVFVSWLLLYSFAHPPPTTIPSFISRRDIISTPWLPSFPLPYQAGNELPQWVGVNGGSVGGQGHTCVHYIGVCVSPPWSVVELGHQSRPHKKVFEHKLIHWAPFWTVVCFNTRVVISSLRAEAPKTQFCVAL